MNLITPELMAVLNRHFESTEVLMYLKMIGVIEQLIPKLESTLDLVQAFHAFDNLEQEIGVNNFGDFEVNIGKPSPVVPGMSRKQAFEAELGTLALNERMKQRRAIMESRDAVKAETKKQDLINQHTEKLEARVAELKVLRSQVEGIWIIIDNLLAKVVQVTISNAQYAAAVIEMAKLRASAKEIETTITIKEAALDALFKANPLDGFTP